MDKRGFRNLWNGRGRMWTFGLCLAGVLVLGSIVAVDRSQRAEDSEPETEYEQTAYLETEMTPEELASVNDTVTDLTEEETPEEAEVSADGEAAPEEKATEEAPQEQEAAAIQEPVQTGEDAAEDTAAIQEETVETQTEEPQASEDPEASQEASSGQVISEQALLDQGIAFDESASLLWPAAGTILIDYSMDGSVYFDTLNQYKYNPALIISSEAGNKVLASARGIVESIGTDEETGTTLVLNIGNGYKLTYGQLKDVAAAQGDVVEAGDLLGYVSEPTKYYSEEGSNLYFKMTHQDEAVDPVLYFEE